MFLRFLVRFFYYIYSEQCGVGFHQQLIQMLLLKEGSVSLAVEIIIKVKIAKIIVLTKALVSN